MARRRPIGDALADRVRTIVMHTTARDPNVIDTTARVIRSDVATKAEPPALGDKRLSERIAITPREYVELDLWGQRIARACGVTGLYEGYDFDELFLMAARHVLGADRLGRVMRGGYRVVDRNGREVRI